MSTRPLLTFRHTAEPKIGECSRLIAEIAPSVRTRHELLMMMTSR